MAEQLRESGPVRVSWDRNKPLNIDGCSYVIFYNKFGSLTGNSTSVPCTTDFGIIVIVEGNIYQFQVALRSDTGLEVYTGPRSVSVTMVISGPAVAETGSVIQNSTSTGVATSTDSEGGNYIILACNYALLYYCR
jgi:hypothetical protein